MNISIGMIKVNVISNIGSLNIGKTILCKNTASIDNHYPVVGGSPSSPVIAPAVQMPS